MNNCALYHDGKSEISLDDFDDLLGRLSDRLEKSEYLLNLEDLGDNVLKPVEEIIGAPLSQDWNLTFSSIETLDEPPRALMNYLHCPKDVSNGGQKTSSTGIAKSVGVEGALCGTILISNTISFA